MKNTLGTIIVLLLVTPTFAQENWLNFLKPHVVEDSSETMTLEASMTQNHVNSMSLAVIDQKGYEGYVAYSTQDSFQRIDINTLYQAGSISKPVAALGVMVLAKKYNLLLDESVNSYLKSWQLTPNNSDASKVTIRNLLSHTAGLNVHGFMGYKKEKKLPEMVDILNGNGNSDAVRIYGTPDEQWRYSGGGYQILHLLIEDISGDDFATFMKREVLEPIGMENSTFEILSHGSCDSCAHAYNRQGKPYKPSWYLYPESAAAGLWTNTKDLVAFLKYMAKLYDGEDGIITTSDALTMFTPIKNDYGFGFFVREKEGNIYIGHSGKNIGFSNDMAINLNTGEGFVCMTDSDAAFPCIEDVKRSIPSDGIWADKPQVVANRIARTAEQLKQFEGEYIHEREGRKPFKAKVVLEGEELVLININSGVRHPLIPVGENDFISKENGSSIKIAEEEGAMRVIIDSRFVLTRE